MHAGERQEKETQEETLTKHLDLKDVVVLQTFQEIQLKFTLLKVDLEIIVLSLGMFKKSSSRSITLFLQDFV